MDESSGFHSELHLSPKPVIALLPLFGVAVPAIKGIWLDPWEMLNAELFYLLTCALALVSWLLVRWRPLVGKWFAILAWSAAIHLASLWLGVPGSLSWAAIPVALATPVIGFSATLFAAGAETVILAALAKFIGVGTDAAVVAIITTWMMVGVVFALYRPAHRVASWSWEFFQRAQTLMDEARERRAELNRLVSDLAHTNRQLALAGERMAALRQIAENAHRAKSEFVANVSHEFRTPLNMILGLVDLMMNTPQMYDVVLSPKMEENLRIVYRNCEHLSSMVNDVLDLTRVESGRLRLNREQVSIGEIIASAAAAVQPLIEKKGLTLQTTAAEDLPEVYCDRTRIRQVIINLLNNAARFTEQGGITVRAVREDQDVVVSVTDTGPGIAPEDMERVFEPFYQGMDGQRYGKGGSGLGLSISRQFVKLHGGRMWLESTPGEGAAFFFTLPLLPPLEYVPSPWSRIQEEWQWREGVMVAQRAMPVEELVKPRVVVCDETGDLFLELARCAEGIELVNTHTLSQTVRELQRCPAHAVIVNSADLNALWMAMDEVKREAAHTPIIGCSVPRRVEDVASDGAWGRLTKPVLRADLEGIIRSAGKPVRRVLVVDDDADFRRLIGDMLQAVDSSIETVTVMCGREALEEIHRSPPDLVLLDIVLPDMDGRQVLASLRREERWKELPVFLISAQDPANWSPASEFLIASIENGLSLTQLLRCSLRLSALLLETA